MEINLTGHFSIDFGTTKSLLAYATPTSNAEIRAECPTAVFFHDETSRSSVNCELGIQALESPMATWQKFKLDMGKPKVELGRRLDPLPTGVGQPEPHFLAALVFRELRRQFLCTLYGNGMSPLEIEQGFADTEIGPLTITVPAESDFKKRQATIFAARVAGFRDVTILEEPVAAYLYHLYKPQSSSTLNRDNTTLVIDFGGGTCDMALVRKESKSNIPVVIATKTVKRGNLDVGGNDIDDSIVRKWISTNRVHFDLSSNKDQIPPDVANCLLKDAVVAKLMMNPVPKDLPEKMDLLQKPLEKRRYGKVARDPYLLSTGQELTPPELTPEDLDEIWSEYEDVIRHDLKLLLGDIQPDHVILAGGSSYLRQFVNFVIKELRLAGSQSKDILLFDEPEKAIVYGALEYQRRGQRISAILPMSIYLELDYSEQEITPIKRKFCEFEVIHHQTHCYVQLASKNDPIKKPTRILDHLKPRNRKLIPIPVHKNQLNWKIIQVRQTENDGQDYKNIDSFSYPLYEVKHKLETIPFSGIINFRYDFDQYGDITIRLGPYLLPDFDWFDQWDNEESHKYFDWRDPAQVIQKRHEFFGH